MLDLVRWLVALELLGFAALPLTTWAFRSLPDRGFIFAKAIALVLVTYITWLVGSFLPVARSLILAGSVAVLIGAIGWWLRRQETVAALREARLAVSVEEGLFLVGLVALSLLRVFTFGSGISHTEQFMDMALMNASIHSASYPPFDPWMSGHTINYYYFGYLIFGTLAKLSGVAPAVGYNLTLSTIFGLVLGSAYAIGYALTRHLLWPLLAPVFLAIIGNWHALLWTAFHGTACPGTSTFWGPIWESSRVIGSGFTLANWAHGPPWTHAQNCPLPSNTIDEYPLFSFILGDLHPHVMSLPFTLLAVGLAIGVLRDGAPILVARSRASIGRLLLLAVAIGALFTINSWDFPTYFLVVAGCIAARAYLHDDRPTWWRQPLETVIVLGVASVVVFAPFYLHFRSPTSGIGRVSAPSDIYEFFQVFGLFLLAGAVLVFSLSSLLQPSAEVEEEDEPATAPAPALTAETGQARLDFASGSSGGSGLLLTAGVLALAVVAVVLHLAVLMLLIVLAGSALVVLHRVLNTEEPNLGDAAALILLAVGCLVVALPEVVYIRDSFDASAMYRMNTVFKFYYQGWTLMCLAAAYGVFRTWRILATLYRPAYGWLALAVLAIGTLGAGPYTVWAFSAQPGDTGSQSLNGEAWLAPSSPDDLAAIRWLRDHAKERSVVLEAVGDDYSNAARISTFTGLPTVMGWIGHEGQWRGADPQIQQRQKDVETIYTTSDSEEARRLLRQYEVRYVLVGGLEQSRYTKNPSGLRKFGRFMRTAYHTGNTTIYSW